MISPNVSDFISMIATLMGSTPPVCEAHAESWPEQPSLAEGRRSAKELLLGRHDIKGLKRFR